KRAQKNRPPNPHASEGSVAGKPFEAVLNSRQVILRAPTAPYRPAPPRGRGAVIVVAAIEALLSDVHQRSPVRRRTLRRRSTLTLAAPRALVNPKLRGSEFMHA